MTRGARQTIRTFKVSLEYLDKILDYLVRHGIDM
jgi:hypothetical protein